jgi:hypothetical protein
LGERGAPVFSEGLDREPDLAGLTLVVSHISRKTSEIWGTPGFLAG